MDRAADHRRQLLRRRGAGGGRRRPQRRLAAGRPAVPARDPAGRRRRPGPARAPGQWPLRSLARRVAAPGHRRRGRLAAGVRSGRSGHHHPGTGGVAGLAGPDPGRRPVLRPARRGGAAAHAPADGRRARPAGCVGQPVRDQRERRLPAAGKPAVPGAGARRTRPVVRHRSRRHGPVVARQRQRGQRRRSPRRGQRHTRGGHPQPAGPGRGTVVPQRPAGRADQPGPGAARAAGFPRRRRRPGRVRAAGDLARGRARLAGRARHRADPAPLGGRPGTDLSRRHGAGGRDRGAVPGRRAGAHRRLLADPGAHGPARLRPDPGQRHDRVAADPGRRRRAAAGRTRAPSHAAGDPGPRRGRVVAGVGLPGAVPGAYRPGDDRPGRRRRAGGDAGRPAAAAGPGRGAQRRRRPGRRGRGVHRQRRRHPRPGRAACLGRRCDARGPHRGRRTRGGAGVLAAQPGGANHADPHRATAQRPRAADRRPGRGHRPAERRLAGGLEPRPGLPQLRRDPHRAGGAADPDLRPRDAVSRR